MVPSLKRLLAALRRLPGVGAKSAQRIGYHLLRAEKTECLELARSIANLTEKVGLCSLCGNIAERDADESATVCEICRDPERDGAQLLVVEEPYNVESFERTGVFGGYYHVLGGLFDPLSGVGAEELGLDRLRDRIAEAGFTEVILATSATAAGEATAAYLRELLAPLGVSLSRIAVGLAAGADVDYADEVSLRLALEGRRELG